MSDDATNPLRIALPPPLAEEVDRALDDWQSGGKLARLWARASALWTGAAGGRFIAITDPGSKVQRMAEVERFRAVYFGLPTIGGRYSALSSFGMVPAAAMGLSPPDLLARAQRMVARCSAEHPARENPGVHL